MWHQPCTILLLVLVTALPHAAATGEEALDLNTVVTAGRTIVELLRHAGIDAPEVFDAERVSVAATVCSARSGSLEETTHQHDSRGPSQTAASAAAAVTCNDTDSLQVAMWLGKAMLQPVDELTAKEREDTARSLSVVHKRGATFCAGLQDKNLDVVAAGVHAFARHFVGCFASEVCTLWPQLRGEGVRENCTVAMLRYFEGGLGTNLAQVCAREPSTGVQCQDFQSDVILQKFDCFDEALRVKGSCSATCAAYWAKKQGTSPVCAKSFGHRIVAQQRAGLDMLRALQPRISITPLPPPPQNNEICGQAAQPSPTFQV